LPHVYFRREQFFPTDLRSGNPARNPLHQLRKPPQNQRKKRKKPRRKRKLPILRKREISQLLPEERQKKLKELRIELGKLRTTVESGGRMENPARIREIRKTIARLMTAEGKTKVTVKE
jgi:large subunit ribosomal protein L29